MDKGHTGAFHSSHYMQQSTGEKRKKGRNSFIMGFCLWVFLLLFQGFYGYGQATNDRYLKYLAVQDLEYLREAIKNTHPAPFVYTTEADFHQTVDTEIGLLQDTVDFYTLRNAVRRILYTVHCVHSNLLSISVSKKDTSGSSNKFFPLELKWIGDSLYVFKNYTKDTLVQPGDRILSINGHTPLEILALVKQYRSGDGINDHFMRGLINLPFQFNILFDQHFPENESYWVKWAGKNNEVMTANLPAIAEIAESPTPKDSLTWLFTSKGKSVQLRLLNEQTAYLQVQDFSGSLLSTFKHCFKMLADKNAGNLVIDLRNNYGGSMPNANHLLSFLIDSAFSHSLKTPIRMNSFDYYDERGRLLRFGGMYYFFMINRSTFSLKNHQWFWYSNFEPRKKNHFYGQIYVLVNEHTLSAASYVASQLKHRTGAILVGMPTGGGEYGNSGYTYTTFSLPNSGFRIKIPHNWVDYDIPTEVQQSLSPHHIVSPTIDDVLNNKDVMLEKTLDLISHKLAVSR